MLKEYLVSVPKNVIGTEMGFEFYEKVQIIKCKAKNVDEIYKQYPNALKVELKRNWEKRE